MNVCEATGTDKIEVFVSSKTPISYLGKRREGTVAVLDEIKAYLVSTGTDNIIRLSTDVITDNFLWISTNLSLYLENRFEIGEPAVVLIDWIPNLPNWEENIRNLITQGYVIDVYFGLELCHQVPSCSKRPSNWFLE